MRPFERMLPRILSVTVLVMIGLEALGLYYLLRLPFSRISVLNYANAADLYWDPPPIPCERTDSHGVEQVLVGSDYGILRQYKVALSKEEAGDVAAARTDLDRLVILRQWARRQYEFNSSTGKARMFDYRGLLENRMRDSGLCDAFATLFAGAAIAHGYPARLIHLNTSGGTDSHGHYTVEVYVTDRRQWVIMDPLYNCYYTVGGKPQSALDLHRLARRQDKAVMLTQVKLERGGATSDPQALSIDEYYQHFQVVARTDFDEYGLNLFQHRLLFLNWTGDGAAPLGRHESVLRILLLFVWPALGIIVAIGLIAVARPRTSMLSISDRKPVRPEYRE